MPTVADYRTSNLLILRVPATARVPVTAEVASSSLVVPAILTKALIYSWPVGVMGAKRCNFDLRSRVSRSLKIIETTAAWAARLAGMIAWV